MKIDINRFFDGWTDAENLLAQEEMCDAERVRKLTMEKVKSKTKRPMKPLTKALLVAAAIVLLTGAVLAVSKGIRVRKIEGATFVAEGTTYEYPEAGIAVDFEPTWDGGMLIGFENFEPTGYTVVNPISNLIEYLEDEGHTVQTKLSKEELSKLLTGMECDYISSDAYDIDGLLRYMESLTGELSEEDRALAGGYLEQLLCNRSPEEYLAANEALNELVGDAMEEVHNRIYEMQNEENTKQFFMINLYSAAQVSEHEFITPQGAALIKEAEINGMQAIFFTSQQDNGEQNSILLYDKEKNCVVHIGGNLTFGALEALAEKIKLVETDIPTFDLTPEFNWNVLHIGRG